jgi:hypothetical protein
LLLLNQNPKKALGLDQAQQWNRRAHSNDWEGTQEQVDDASLIGFAVPAF